MTEIKDMSEVCHVCDGEERIPAPHHSEMPCPECSVTLTKSQYTDLAERDGLEQLLEKVPEGWFIQINQGPSRQNEWECKLNFPPTRENKNWDVEIGHGPTPTAAITAALRKIER